MYLWLKMMKEKGSEYVLVRRKKERKVHTIISSSKVTLFFFLFVSLSSIRAEELSSSSPTIVSYPGEEVCRCLLEITFLLKSFV